MEQLDESSGSKEKITDGVAPNCTAAKGVTGAKVSSITRENIIQRFQRQNNSREH